MSITCSKCGQTKTPRASSTSGQIQGSDGGCAPRVGGPTSVSAYRNSERARSERRQFLRGYLATHPCVDCGESDPAVLEFDHLHDKRMDVTRMAHAGWSLDAIRREIAKCEVRCANYHPPQDEGATRGQEDGTCPSRTCDPDRNRTCDFHVRSVALYPLSYGVVVQLYRTPERQRVDPERIRTSDRTWRLCLLASRARPHSDTWRRVVTPVQ